MTRRDSIRAAIREALVAIRAERARRFAAETQPADSWLDDAAWLAEEHVHAIEAEATTENTTDPAGTGG